MIRPNIIDLRQFYSSRLGRKVKQRLRAIVLNCWSNDTTRPTIVGIGYAVPVLRVLERENPAVLLALMPADQGAIYWPVHHENRSVLGDELVPPFAVNSLHRVVMLHAFEHLTKPLDALKIYWQLLKPGGRLLLIVPNRRGLWASLGNTPFTRGTPYSIAQVRELLNDAEFTVREVGSALFAPPSSHPFWVRCWSVLEMLGQLLVPNLGGVWVIEAEKQIYAGLAQPLPAVRHQWIPAQAGTASTAKTLLLKKDRF